MPYRRAFSTLGCGELSLAQSLQLARNFQLDGVEVRALAGSLDVPAALTAEFGSPEKLANWLGSQHGSIFSLDTSLRLIGATKEQRAEFLRFVPWAEQAGVRWLRVFDGGRAADDEELAAARDTFRWWRNLREARGWQVDVMIETHDCLFTAAKIQRFTSVLPGVAILWDAHHTWKKGAEAPVETWAEIASHVVHLHVKDSVSTPDAKHPYTYVFPGMGEFPAAPLMDRLRREFSGCVSLEWERHWHPDLPPLDQALRAAGNNRWW